MLHHHTLDNISTLQALGFQGFIQATRDTTGSLYNSFQSMALPTLTLALVYLGFSAWREGNALRKASAGAALNQRDFGLLTLCLLLDLIGGSFDAFDLVWAPCSALLLYSLFDSPFIAVINAMKELLPFTDVVPVATLAWLLAYAYPEATLTRVLAVRRIDEESERLDDWE